MILFPPLQISTRKNSLREKKNRGAWREAAAENGDDVLGEEDDVAAGVKLEMNQVPSSTSSTGIC